MKEKAQAFVVQQFYKIVEDALEYDHSCFPNWSPPRYSLKRAVRCVEGFLGLPSMRNKFFPRKKIKTKSLEKEVVDQNI